MSSVGDTGSVANIVVEQHRRMREVAQEIQETQDLDHLWRRLREYRALLQEHFGTEEAPDGFFEAVRTAAPCHPVAIDALKREHEKFLAHTDGIAQRIRACLETTVAELVSDVHRLMRGVRDHEARENAMLMDIVYTDLGHGDA
jgi:hemerythrin HHE cation binding domain-containing protein